MSWPRGSRRSGAEMARACTTRTAACLRDNACEREQGGARRPDPACARRPCTLRSPRAANPESIARSRPRTFSRLPPPPPPPPPRIAARVLPRPPAAGRVPRSPGEQRPLASDLIEPSCKQTLECWAHRAAVRPVAGSALLAPVHGDIRCLGLTCLPRLPLDLQRPLEATEASSEAPRRHTQGPRVRLSSRATFSESLATEPRASLGTPVTMAAENAVGDISQLSQALTGRRTKPKSPSSAACDLQSAYGPSPSRSNS